MFWELEEICAGQGVVVLWSWSKCDRQSELSARSLSEGLPVGETLHGRKTIQLHSTRDVEKTVPHRGEQFVCGSFGMQHIKTRLP